ncbi:hypothetical protein Tco_1133081, partial [Tanacetum coccineum]
MAESSILRAFSLFLLAFAASEVFGADTEGDAGSVVVWFPLVIMSHSIYAFTWSHKNASKMSKLDRFLLSKGLFDFFPHLSAICLDKNLLDHRPILLRESCLDYGPTPFRFFHSWFSLDGFDAFVENNWNSLMVSDDNALIRLQRKLQLLKIAIKSWTKEFRLKSNAKKCQIQQDILCIDKLFDLGLINDDSLNKRALLLNELHEINSVNASELS